MKQIQIANIVVILAGSFIAIWGAVAPSMMPAIASEPLIAVIEENPRDDWDILISQKLAAGQRREYTVLTVLGVVIVISGLSSLYICMQRKCDENLRWV